MVAHGVDVKMIRVVDWFASQLIVGMHACREVVHTQVPQRQGDFTAVASWLQRMVTLSLVCGGMDCKME